MKEQTPIAEVKELKQYFLVRRSLKPDENLYLHAVDGVSLTFPEGETVGLVGESGCGKSTLGRTLLRLYDPTDGEVWFNGQRIDHMNARQMRPIRKEMQMIFQDPYASLNPRKTILESVQAPLAAFGMGTAAGQKDRALQILEYVGLEKPQAEKYPHEMSGGQRQRAVIARALITDPRFIVCDEPVSALDVSVRSQVLNLMRQIQEERGLAYLFISHDLSVVRYLCHQIAVMYLGKIVEIGDKEEIFSHPLHPYTRALMSAIPVPDVHAKRQRIILQGDVPNPVHPPSGCAFKTRCPHGREECEQIPPPLEDAGGGHCVACYRYKQV